MIWMKKMKYSPFIKKFGTWFLPRIERFDCGFKDPETRRPRSFYTSDHICDVLNGSPDEWDRPLFLSNVTKTHLHEHHEGVRTIYYRSNRKAPVATFMGDIDAHDKQQDAVEACQWVVEQWFPGAYHEPSTGGKGCHLFLNFDVEFIKRDTVNYLLRCAAEGLDRMLCLQGFESNFCSFCGTYTKFSNVKGYVRIEKRGTLGKIPRLPMGEPDLDHLIASPVFPVMKLVEMLKVAEHLPKRPKERAKQSVSPAPTEDALPLQPLNLDRLDEEVPAILDDLEKEGREEGDHTQTPKVISVSLNDTEANSTRSSSRSTPIPPMLNRSKGNATPPRKEEDTHTQPLKAISVSVPYTGGSEAWKSNPKLHELYHRAINTVKPLMRMRRASSLYYHIHGHYAPNELTLVSFYEHLQLNTGTDEKEARPERARMALEMHRLSEQKKLRKGFKSDEWLPLVQRYVTNEVRGHSAIRYRYRVDDELLAAGLYLFTLNAFKANRTDRMHSCDQTAQLAFYLKLMDAGTIKAKVGNKNKRVVVPKLLQLAGLIVLRDGKHKYGGTKGGVGDKFGLGRNHPRFEEFVSRFGNVVDPQSLPVVVNQSLSNVA